MKCIKTLQIGNQQSMKIMISSPKSRGAAPGHRRLKEKGTLQIGTKISETGTVTQKTEKIGTVHKGPIAEAVVKFSNSGEL